FMREVEAAAPESAVDHDRERWAGRRPTPLRVAEIDELARVIAVRDALVGGRRRLLQDAAAHTRYSSARQSFTPFLMSSGFMPSVAARAASAGISPSDANRRATTCRTPRRPSSGLPVRTKCRKFSSARIARSCALRA